MSINNLILLIAASISAVRAIDPTQSAELNAILNDAKGNLPQYMSVASQVSIPPEIFQLGLAIATAADDSYTTLYSQIDFNQVSTLMTALPWYSSRLEPAISSALATLTPTATGSTSSQPTSQTNSSPATSQASSSSASGVTSSSASGVTSSSASGATSSSKASSASSTEAPSNTVTSSKSSEASSTTSTVSQTSSHQVSQTSNAAPKPAIGMGAGVLAAAAMLL
ncbi:hypothetical protein HG536_0F03400 [Torulaspora globosa]|uniref:Temperature shock-inducible protein 1 n=1 Tax=Torulaspora globosa TaxID=48254 RepID=A0A7G3ZKH9_9SACH|nr:uncharacterized protein HG536_0F03400 [Torulaspora globosa]QLL34015.1 hypothetical protein HG536_0F03400 [Torulaspora globosa]